MKHFSALLLSVVLCGCTVSAVETVNNAAEAVSGESEKINQTVVEMKEDITAIEQSVPVISDALKEAAKQLAANEPLLSQINQALQTLDFVGERIVDLKVAIGDVSLASNTIADHAQSVKRQVPHLQDRPSAWLTFWRNMSWAAVGLSVALAIIAFIALSWYYQVHWIVRPIMRRFGAWLTPQHVDLEAKLNAELWVKNNGNVPPETNAAITSARLNSIAYDEAFMRHKAEATSKVINPTT